MKVSKFFFLGVVAASLGLYATAGVNYSTHPYREFRGKLVDFTGAIIWRNSDPGTDCTYEPNSQLASDWQRRKQRFISEQTYWTKYWLDGKIRERRPEGIIIDMIYFTTRNEVRTSGGRFTGSKLSRMWFTNTVTVPVTERHTKHVLLMNAPDDGVDLPIFAFPLGQVRVGGLLFEAWDYGKPVSKPAAPEPAQAEGDISKKLNELDSHSTTLNDLKSQEAALKQKAKDLEVLKLQSATKNDALRAKQLKQQAKQWFQPKDPWRIIDGKIYNAKDKDWFQFTGRVLAVKPTGILLLGDFGPPLEAGFGKRKYFLENFPNDKYPVADGEEITTTGNFVAHLGGKTTFQYTNTTIDLNVETVRRLDYGKVCGSPPLDLVKQWEHPILLNVAASGPDSEIVKEIEDNQNKLSAIKQRISQVQGELLKQAQEEKIRQLKEAQENAKRQREAKLLAFNQELANKGDSVGLRRMGERYRDGNGVEKDLAISAQYFKKADDAAEVGANKLNQEKKLNEQVAKQQKFAWHLDQANKGNPASMVYLGKCYLNGDGVEKDLNKAKEYFNKASGAHLAGFEKASLEAAKLLLNFE